MKANIDKIAKALGVKRVRDERVDMGKVARILGTKSAGKVTAKGGYFGAMQLAEEVRTRLQKPAGGGRSTDPEWTERRLLPLKPATLDRLARIAGSIKARSGVEVHPLQIAAILLERDTETLTDEEADKLVGVQRVAR
jgi:hypothetical protein